MITYKKDSKDNLQLSDSSMPVLAMCYDFTPVMKHTVVSGLLAVTLPTSGIPHSHGVTGGVYKTRERIHRSMLTCDY